MRTSYMVSKYLWSLTPRKLTGSYVLLLELRGAVFPFRTLRTSLAAALILWVSPFLEVLD
jgi:hypothetical protein